MQAGISDSRFAGWFSLVLLTVAAVVVNTGELRAMPYSQQANAPLLLADSSNPWALPEAGGNETENRQQMQNNGRRRNEPRYYEDDNQWQPRSSRFVTPEILDSIKRQQTQNQLMYGNPYYQPYVQPQPNPRSYGNYYSAPPPASVFIDPLYNVPPVSPWGNAPDLLYRGQAYPLVPNEAVGGLPPIPLYNSAPGVSDRFFDPFGFSQGMYGY